MVADITSDRDPLITETLNELKRKGCRLKFRNTDIKVEVISYEDDLINAITKRNQSQ